MMKVLLVNGSPHKQGCTYTALSEVASTLNEEGIETDFYWIGNKPIGGCIGCFQCANKKQCVFDDKVNELTRLAAEYDGFFSKPSDSIAPQGYPIEGSKESPSERSKSHEAQIEDQCFKRAAGRRDRFMPQCLHQGKAPAFSLRG